MYIREFYQILFKNQFHFLCILWLILRTLSDVLYHGGNSAVCRQQAGVQLKNFLYTNDESLRAQYEERWLNIPEDVRQYTKQNVVGALGTESFRPSAAAQCIHMIAVVELPRGCWPGKWHLLKIKKNGRHAPETRVATKSLWRLWWFLWLSTICIINYCLFILNFLKDYILLKG